MNFQNGIILLFLTIKAIDTREMTEENNILRFLAETSAGHSKRSILDVLFKSKEKFCDIMGGVGFHSPRPNLKLFIYCDNSKLSSHLEYCRKKIIDMNEDEFIDFYLKQNHNPTTKEMVDIICMLTSLNFKESSLTPEVAEEIWDGNEP